jgi:hypothetical protein
MFKRIAEGGGSNKTCKDAAALQAAHYIASGDRDDIGRHGVLELSYGLHDNQQLISTDVLVFLVGLVGVASSLLPGQGVMTTASPTVAYTVMHPLGGSLFGHSGQQ